MLCLRAQREYGLFLEKTVFPRQSWLRPIGVCGISALWFSRAKKNWLLHQSPFSLAHL